jgi:hypothetical protein
MQALADNPAFWVLLFAVLAVVYLLPTLIALIRGTDAVALVFLVNLIGGLSGVGWLGAMILAFGPRRLPPHTAGACMARGAAKAHRTVDAGPAVFPLNRKVLYRSSRVSTVTCSPLCTRGDTYSEHRPDRYPLLADDRFVNMSACQNSPQARIVSPLQRVNIRETDGQMLEQNAEYLPLTREDRGLHPRADIPVLASID